MRGPVLVMLALVMLAALGCRGVPAGTGPAGTGPAGTGPAGTGPASTGPEPWIDLLAASWSATSFGGEGQVSAQDGALVFEPGDPLTGVTWSEPLPPGDYELDLLATRLYGDDFFVGLTFPVGAAHLTLVLGGWGGALCGLSCIDGEDASGNETKFFRSFERGRPYRVRVEVLGPTVRCFLDEALVVDLDTRGRVLSLRTEVEACAPLGLATFLTKASFRGMRWRPR